MVAYDAIVIGSGWSGVVATRNLSKKYKVLLIEARDRIGGRARTYDLNGTKIDLGCSFIHGYKEGNPAKDIAKEFGVAAHLTKPTGSALYSTNAPDSSLQSRLSVNLSTARTEAKTSLSDSHPSPTPTTPLSSFLLGPNSPLFTDLSQSDKDVAVAYARTLEVPYGATLEQVALKWAGWENAYAGSDAAPEGGFQHLVEKIVDSAKTTGNVDLKLGETVTKVKLYGNSGCVKVSTDSGEVYSAKTVVCTIPLGVLKRTAGNLFEPALPLRRAEIIKGTHVGILEKLVLAYPDAWWPDASTTGSYVFLPTEYNAKDEPKDARAVLEKSTLIVASFAAPSLPKQHPTLLFYLSPTPALGLAKFPLSDVVSAAHDYLSTRFGVSSAPKPMEKSTMTNWHSDPLAYGATTTPSVVGEDRGPLDFFELGKPLWEGRLGFAGEHTEPEHRGSVAGAVVSGFREAERVGKVLENLNDE